MRRHKTRVVQRQLYHILPVSMKKALTGFSRLRSKFTGRSAPGQGLQGVRGDLDCGYKRKYYYYLLHLVLDFLDCPRIFCSKQIIRSTGWSNCYQRCHTFVRHMTPTWDYLWDEAKNWAVSQLGGNCRFLITSTQLSQYNYNGSRRETATWQMR